MAGSPSATRDRILAVAVDLFGRSGFAVGLRAIATEAGVSPGLIVHHFGSKDGLREACDAHVLSEMRELQKSAVKQGARVSLMDYVGTVGDLGPALRYMMQSLQDGGPFAVALMEHLIADTAEYLADGERAGFILPSAHPDARARFLTYQSAGALLLWLRTHPGEADNDDFGAAVQAYMAELGPGAVELFGQGLLIDRTMLDDYLMYVPDPPGEASA